MVNQKWSSYSYPISKYMFKIKNNTNVKNIQNCLKLIKLMILFLTHGMNPHAKPLSIPCFLKCNRHLSKSEKEEDPKVAAGWG